MRYRTKYELSMYDGVKKVICVSALDANTLMRNWRMNSKPMGMHLCKNGEKIETHNGNVDYIKIITE